MTKEALAQEPTERNFCERCGKRLSDGIHTCTPPAKQEQGEPVCDKDPQGCYSVRCQLGNKCKNTPQPAQKPLTDEELKPHIEIAMKYYGYDSTKYGLTTTSGFVWLARAIEAAHGIKENT